MKFPTIHIEGNIISTEILEKIELGELAGQSPKDFGFVKQMRMRDEISAAWSTANSQWKIYKSQRDKASKDTSGVSETRKFWMVPFLGLIGYELDANREAWSINNKSYAISHRVVNRGDFPVHIMGFNDSLDMKRSDSGPRMSPHSLVQEYINITDSLYALVTNGLTIRLLRDSSRLIKLSYLEFDLEQMFDEEHYADFSLLYRLLHVSRLPESKENSASCILEKYHQDSIDSGARIRDGLSNAVEKSLVNLGKGFLIHKDNDSLRKAIEDKQLSSVEFYRNIRRLIYRLLFLMVAEDRDLIFPSAENLSAAEKEKQIRNKNYYKKYYSIDRLRVLSGKPYLYSKESTDLWRGLLSNFRLFEDNGKGMTMGIYPLDGFLFSPNAVKWLEGSIISNELLLSCIRELNWFKNEQGLSTRINYGSLDVEELGSVYEGLLELQPVIEQGGEMISVWNFLFREGTDRKTTGSYYTRPDLVHELVKSALLPVIEERLTKVKTVAEKEKALLSLKVCDTAAGSGHILLAASRAIAWRLARVRTDEENPSPGIYRQALREVIQHCIYGVDMNPDAVELCQLALWIEGHNSGKPLSFLEHKIRCGNSLIGVVDLSVLKKGLPDNAFNPVTGDDKEICQILKKENKKYIQSQQTALDFANASEIAKEQKHFAEEYQELDLAKQDTVEEIKILSAKYGKLRVDPQWYKDWCACNLYTAAFFYTYTKLDDAATPSSKRLANYLISSGGVEQRAIANANVLSSKEKFFHWSLEFPDVFEQGGFDVMMGNPPWEAIQPEEKDFFKNTKIGSLSGSKRKQEIADLKINDPLLYLEWKFYVKKYDAFTKYFRNSDRYRLTSNGKLNTYSLFAEFNSSIINTKGKISIIVPTGIATDNSNKDFFESLLNNGRIEKLLGFENEEFIFPTVHHSFKFCLITILGQKIAINESKFIFFCRKMEDLNDKQRYFQLSANDVLLINPNTKTCPIFRTGYDSELTKSIYKKFPVFNNHLTSSNPWNVQFKQGLYNMTSDSNLFNESQEKHSLPLYEAKMIFQFDHRYSTFKNATQAQLNMGTLPNPSIEEKQNPNFKIETRYSINQDVYTETKKEIAKNYSWNKEWFSCFRDVTSSISERTSIFTIVPSYPLGNNMPIIFSNFSTTRFACLIGMCNSLAFDYITRQKIAGNHLNFFYLEQLPCIPPERFSNSEIEFLVPKLIELFYNSWDIKPFADDLWQDSNEKLKEIIKYQWEQNKANLEGPEFTAPSRYELNEAGIKLPPFKWDEERRAVLKAELDAYYAKLYGLTDQELRYILDPVDVYGEDFPGETFRVLKEKDIKKYGEYRTKRLVLEAWERLKK